MRRALIATIILISAASTPERAAASDWADQLFAARRHDFGKVPRGSVMRHEFVLNNLMEEPVSIVKVHASCGCTTGKADASVVRPGRSTVVFAEMDTRKFVGKKSTVLYVTLATPSGRESEVQLGLTSHIVGDIILSPGTIDFGAVARGQTASQSLAIERVGKADWKIQRMVTECRAVDGSVVETLRDGKVVGYTLKLDLRPDAPVGALRDEIRLVTNDPEAPSFTIQVIGQVRGTLTASPSHLTLGVAAQGMESGAEGRYLVRSTKPFTVRSVEGVGDGFEVKTDNELSKSTHILTVNYRPGRKKTPGEIRHAFRVFTDLPGEPPLELMAICPTVTPPKLLPRP